MPLAPQEIRTYFVTTVTASRRRIFQVDQTATLLLEILHSQRAKSNLYLHAYVVMPDHLHLLVTPSHLLSLEKAMQLIKGNFSFRHKSRLDIWQPSFDSRRIQDQLHYQTHLNYIHQNPIRAALAQSPELFPYSSAHPTAQIDPTPLHFR